jgi:hypothetical protein
MSRNWLAALLRDEAPACPGDAADWRIEAVLETARREGVVALAHAKLREGAYPDAVTTPFAAAARGEAAMLMVREAECRRVLAVISAGGLQALLLKGSALAYWAYPEPHLRECVDIDLLLRSRAGVEKLAGLLAESGYRLRERDVPGDLVSYELTCIRRSGNGARTDLDLHWRLVNAPLYAHRLEPDELWQEAIALPRLGPAAFGLSPVHALLHACMHRVLNLQFGTGNRLKWLYDLHLLAARLDDAGWQRLLALAGERRLASTCLHSLRAASVEFHTAIPEQVAAGLARLAATEDFDAGRAQHWLYMQIANGRSLPDLRTRLRWLRQRLLPNATFLRDRYGAGQQGLGMIVLSRLRSGLARLGF